MLLPKEPNAVEHLPRTGRGGVHPLAQLRVFGFELGNSLFGVHVAATALCGDSLEPRFGGLRTFAEGGELLAQVADERFEFA